jgi:uncharacterized protein
MARRELQIARDVAARIGARHVVRTTDELGLEAYQRNDPNRCYWCKHTLFAVCQQVTRELGLSEIAYGYTADDVHDIRPGHRAAGEFGVRSPLYESGLHKDDIRGIARLLELSVWDKPAAPCLSSRIPHGSAVSADKLRQIEAVEDLLADLGFSIYRARFDGSQMRIEMAAGDIARAASPEVRTKLLALGERLGIRVLTLDLAGFRSGRLHEIG